MPKKSPRLCVHGEKAGAMQSEGGQDWSGGAAWWRRAGLGWWDGISTNWGKRASEMDWGNSYDDDEEIASSQGSRT